MFHIAHCDSPLDGGSMGVAAALALLSLVVEDKQPDKDDDGDDDEEEQTAGVVVTGGMDLTGKVLPVAGLAGRLQVSGVDASRQAGGPRRSHFKSSGRSPVRLSSCWMLAARRVGG